MAADGAPTPQLLAPLRELLMKHPPFDRMAPAQVERLLAGAVETYHAPGETVLAPADGPVDALRWIRTGAVRGEGPGMPPREIGAGELFPVGALLAQRPVTSTYVAQADLFCLLLAGERVREVAAGCAPFADFLARRAWKLLDDARRALQASLAAPAVEERTLEQPLSTLAHRDPFALPRDASIGEALAAMRERRVGSVLVVDAAGRAEGIFTRHDVLDRIALAGRPMDAPLAEVMSAPVATLDERATGHEAAILMSRHGIRHVPVTGAEGRLVGIVSERDLFALQRLSLRGVAAAIRAAPDVAAMRAAAADIRTMARNLVAQGTGARALTALVSHLNDEVAARLVALHAAEDGLDLKRACWLAFGSEGRGEQTIATDQDNGLVFASDDPARDRPRWLAFARRVNESLDACGYPLCKGNVMASNPECCRTVDEWLERFGQWMERGTPEDLLAASIYFDLRPVAGHLALAAPLRETVTVHAARLPRLQRQLAENLLQRRPPLNWLGGLDTQRRDGRAVIDLKLAGTAIFVDAARLYALAHGIAETGTRVRFEAAGRAMGVPESEREAWSAGFEFLQMLRLARQWRDEAGAEPNLVEPEALNELDRRVLVETMRVARRLQQRIELDYLR